MGDWPDSTAGALAFISGVPQLIVPDNPKATNAAPLFGSPASLAKVRAWQCRPERAARYGSAIKAGP